MLLRVPSEKVFDLSICRTKAESEIASLASAMTKSVMPSWAKNGNVSKGEKV